jgi:hypothetical protein
MHRCVHTHMLLLGNQRSPDSPDSLSELDNQHVSMMLVLLNSPNTPPNSSWRKERTTKYITLKCPDPVCAYIWPDEESNLGNKPRDFTYSYVRVCTDAPIRATIGAFNLQAPDRGFTRQCWARKVPKWPEKIELNRAHLFRQFWNLEVQILLQDAAIRALKLRSPTVRIHQIYSSFQV